MKVETYRVKKAVVERDKNKDVFFTEKAEAKSFAKKIETKMKEHGFKVLCAVDKEKTADGKDIFVVSGALYYRDALIPLLVPVSGDEVVKDFFSKKKAEEEVKKFYNDFKDVICLFDAKAEIVQ